MMIHDNRQCQLGEGAFWHPERQQFFWFDIKGKRLLSQQADGSPLEWRFDRMASAAGWIDRDRAIFETLTGIKRAGARNILTYWATEAAQKLGRG